ncbi:MAG: ATP-binding cassette domain-containing protein [Nitrospirae bacterium]|nr:ATP-binding cassette domain-containing protein [Nitrospirota bacterium]
MPLLRLDDVSLAYGPRPLLDHVKLDIRRGERVCLVGRNGEGKSSLMNLLIGEIAPDSGAVWIRPGTRVAHLAQEVANDSPDTVFDIVAGGLAEMGRLLSQYHHAAAELAHDHAPAAVTRLSELQHELDTRRGWAVEQRVETVLSRLGLDGETRMQSLSGGWRRRALLARALVCEPDLLLLDEPTNHLDIEAITWLEDFMAGYQGAVLFISHDRAFLKRLATRIIELDRGQLSSWPGSYQDYLRLKAEQLAVEAQHNVLFDKKLSQEEVWIRQGVKARRTRNEGRVRALEALREKRRRRRDRIGLADLKLEEGEKSGQLVFEAEKVNYRYGTTAVVRDFTVRIMRGDRIGIIGPNGAGKSTLIKLLLGELSPDSGRLYRGTRLQTAYFDQQRNLLDPEATLMESVGGGQSVTINGRSRHVAGYLQDFLFPPERLRSTVSTLSGGERNRLLLARLFAQPANLLVMDEPTNDLDVETLELLEELLLDYQGTLLLVSHDRAFLDNAVTSTLVFEGGGRIGEYVGGYSDWKRYQERLAPQKTGPLPQDKPARPASLPAAGKRTGKLKKLSFKEVKELTELPVKIESLESERLRLNTMINDPAFYKKPPGETAATLARLEAITPELEACYARWEMLDSQAAAAG